MKERLVGAAVLMAAAIILIPEMLSGPGRDSAEKQQAAQASGDGEGAGESAIKTYTIDLSQAPGSVPPNPTEQTDSRVPPPEEMPSAIPAPPESPQVSPESQPVSPAEAPAERAPPPAVAETPKPEPRSETPRQAAAQPPTRAEAPPKSELKLEPKAEPPKPEPRAVASAPAAPTSAAPTASATGKGWAVQLGSYSTQATAQRLANEWRAKGQNAFVMPVTTGGKTLYRVRIGPSKDRAGAEATLKAVKPSTPGAAVVAHP